MNKVKVVKSTKIINYLPVVDAAVVGSFVKAEIFYILKHLKLSYFEFIVIA